jgi:type II secretory pathway pseudopilin PulG
VNPFPIRAAATGLRSPSHQRGMATLMVVMVLLLALSMGMVWAARSAIQSQQFAQNHVLAVQAQEVARAALEEEAAWLAQLAANTTYPASQPAACPATAPTPFDGACWTKETTLAAPFGTTALTRAPFNAPATGFLALKLHPGLATSYTVGGNTYTVQRHVRYSPALAAINYLEVQASATLSGDANPDGSVNAVMSELLYFPILTASPQTRPLTPFMANQGLSVSLLSYFNLCPQRNDGASPCQPSVSGGSTVAALYPNASNNLTLSLSGSNLHGGSGQNSTISTVMAAMFPGLSLNDLQNTYNMQVAAGLTDLTTPQRTIWFTAQGLLTVGNSSYGSKANPVIVVSTCPTFYLLGIPLSAICTSLGTNITVYGAYYQAPSTALLSLDLSAFSGTTVYGVAGFEATSLSLGSTITAIYDGGFDDAIKVMGLTPTCGVCSARAPGTLRDF